MKFSQICLFLSISSILTVFSCKNASNSEKQKSQKTTIQNLRYAKGFDITSQDGKKIVRLFRVSQDNSANRDTLIYILVKKGDPKPLKTPKTMVVEIPATKWVITSTTHIGFLEALGSENVLIGATSTDFIYSEKIQKQVKNKKITSLSDQDLSAEVIVALQPDLMMISAFSSQEGNKSQKLIDLGIPVVINSEWLENSPLGKAEWIKFVAAFLDKDAKADSIFTEIEKEYKQYQKITEKVTQKPSVLTGMAYKGTWYVAGGQSFVARCIKDAGGKYLWENTPETGSFPLSLEQVYEKASNADIWINVDASQKAEIEQTDKRYADFKPYKTNKIFNLRKRIAKNGGNDLWESGVVKPHLVLADFIKMFHPELLPQYEFYFYKAL
jgi:iron complex transport system substrate-binding protein